MLSYTETPVEEIKSELLDRTGVSVFVKREDLNNRQISGNKWWKLKYNLAEALRLDHATVLTFGGAYSNHIFSTAAATFQSGLRSIGIIRGEKILPLNPTLAFAEENKMHLHFLSREAYRKKDEESFIHTLRKEYGEFYLLPEGGTNALAIKGCAEFAKEFLSGIAFDYLCLPVGTGGTMAGLIQGLEGKKKIIGFSALKGEGFLQEQVQDLLTSVGSGELGNWEINTAYHFGGYGKRSPALNDFIAASTLPLDPVYTSKMMFGIFDGIQKGIFEKGSNILALHTGGLQLKA